jgi:hypothetical protein
MSSDLFNNPMVSSAKNAMTPEQIDDYKRIGEYMYNNVDYKNISMVSEAKEADIVLYASEALKSGLDPKELTKQEIEALERTYGDKWYEKYNLEKEDLPVFTVNITPDQIIKNAEDKLEKLNLDRNQKRKMKRKLAKLKGDKDQK